jgi:uncharacterized protein (TIGR03067 family)
MKPIVSASIIIAATAAFAPADAPPSGDLAKIQGTWTTKAGPDHDIAVTLTIEGHRATVRLALPGGDTFQARGEVRINETVTPKAWDWVKFAGLDGQELPEIPAIYELDGDMLTVCNGGPANDRPTKFQAGESSLADLYRFHRHKGDSGPSEPTK